MHMASNGSIVALALPELALKETRKLQWLFTKIPRIYLYPGDTTGINIPIGDILMFVTMVPKGIDQVAKALILPIMNIPYDRVCPRCVCIN